MANISKIDALSVIQAMVRGPISQIIPKWINCNQNVTFLYNTNLDSLIFFNDGSWIHLQWYSLIKQPLDNNEPNVMPKDCYSQPVQPSGKSMIKSDSKVSFLLVGCWFVQWCKLYLVICMAHMRVLLDWNSSTVILKVQWPAKLGTEREMRHPSNLSMLSLQSSEEVPQINNLVIGNISRCIPDVTLYNLTVLSEAPVTRVLSLRCQLRHSTLPKTWGKRCPLSWNKYIKHECG